MFSCALILSLNILFVRFTHGVVCSGNLIFIDVPKQVVIRWPQEGISEVVPGAALTGAHCEAALSTASAEYSSSDLAQEHCREDFKTNPGGSLFLPLLFPSNCGSRKLMKQTVTLEYVRSRERERRPVLAQGQPPDSCSSERPLRQQPHRPEPKHTAVQEPR